MLDQTFRPIRRRAQLHIPPRPLDSQAAEAPMGVSHTTAHRLERKATGASLQGRRLALEGHALGITTYESDQAPAPCFGAG